MAKAKFPIMTLTDSAADRVRTLMAGHDAVGLRVGVKNGGCAGMSYTLDYVREIGPYDEAIEDKGVKVIIDPKALMFLFGTQMDFQGRQARFGLYLQQPEPDGRLRLRRVGGVDPGERSTDRRSAARQRQLMPSSGRRAVRHRTSAQAGIENGGRVVVRFVQADVDSGRGDLIDAV